MKFGETDIPREGYNFTLISSGVVFTQELNDQIWCTWFGSYVACMIICV